MNKETTEIPFGVDSGATEYVCYIPDGMEAIVEDGKVIVKKKESEDERIRKEILDFINQYKENGLRGVDITPWIAYLEKQKVNTEGDFGRGYDCGYEACLNSHGAEWFEKQKEQKFKFYPGDVVKCTSTGSLWVRCKDGDNIRSDGHTACIGGEYELASKEEVVQFFKELTENGYQWDCIKGRPMKKEQKHAEWSEEDENRFRNLIYLVLDSEEGRATKEGFISFINRLKSLRPQSHWKPSEVQMSSLRLAIDSAKKAQMYATADILNEIYEQLKKL